MNGVAKVIMAALAIAACGRGRGREAIPQATLALHLRGAPVATLDGTGLARLGAENVRVHDPHEHRDLELRGVNVVGLLDATVGPAWRSQRDLVATCADGFHPTIAVALLQQREAFLAFARSDSADFAVVEGGKRVPVGPYYLVWKEAPGEDPPEPAWPYQITGLDVIDGDAETGALLPPADATPLAREGLERFRTSCLPCHAINGTGGQVGPELNYPVSVVEYFAEPVLRLWIADPRQVRWNAKMAPPFSPGSGQARSIDAVVAYLQAMARAKRAPAP